MPELHLHGKRTHSIFQLLGDHENDISYSVGWALAKCPSFLAVVLGTLLDAEPAPDSAIIRLQQHEGNGGITDIEIELPPDIYVIIEAKRGWNVPGAIQLEKYAHRKSFVESQARVKLIVAASECSREYALLNLPSTEVSGIAVRHLSWKEFYNLALRARRRGTHAEKRLLEELTAYLRGLMTMQHLDSNWVFVVSLRDATEPGWGISWTDIVRQRQRYFHPVGKSGWPSEPPNYIAFRYGGRLRSIHHVEDYEIITNLHTRFAEIPDKEEPPLFLYTLGAAFAPDHDLPTGNIYPSGRVWCMLDTLFTSTTIADARDVSKQRESKMGQE